jgi:hypothetical protein
MSELSVTVETSPEVGDLFAALAQAQAEIEGASKDAKNDHFRQKYATLASIYDASRAALTKHGIAVIQSPFNDGQDVGVATTLGVASGQWLRGRIQCCPTKADAQGVGSVITYMRRYALAAMVGVAQEDDDAEGAMGRSSKPSAPRAEPKGQSRADRRDAQDNEEHKLAQAHYSRLREAVLATLDHAELDELERREASALALIKKVSPTGYETITGMITAKHDYISRGPGER